jgi:hypothetical protein
MEQVVYVVEVGKIRVDFDHPVRYAEYHCSDVEQGDLPAQERFVLYPCYNVVHHPREVKEDGCAGKIPSIGISIREYESPMGHAEDELDKWLADEQ